MIPSAANRPAVVDAEVDKCIIILKSIISLARWPFASSPWQDGPLDTDVERAPRGVRGDRGSWASTVGAPSFACRGRRHCLGTHRPLEVAESEAVEFLRPDVETTPGLGSTGPADGV